jgi:hypothetical protein
MSPGEGQGRPASPPPRFRPALAAAGETILAVTPGLPPPNFFPAIC